MSPSISCCGTSAATESITMISTAPERSKRFRDLESLLSGVRLRNKKLVDIYAERLCVHGIECVLRVDERSLSAELLNLGNRMKCDRCFTADSGPSISILPRGSPPTPSAMSSVSDPVETALTFICAFSPIFIIAP